MYDEDEPDFGEPEFAPGTTEVSGEAPKYPSAVNVSLDLGAICEGIRADIVRATAYELYAMLKYEIQNDVRSALQDEIDHQLSAIVTEALSNRIQPTDEWGEPVGEQTTVRDMLREKAAKFLDEQVDRKGEKATSSYSAEGPRWKWACKELVSTQLEGVLKSELSNVVKAMRDRLQAELPAILAERK